MPVQEEELGGEEAAIGLGEGEMPVQQEELGGEEAAIGMGEGEMPVQQEELSKAGVIMRWSPERVAEWFNEVG